MAHQGRHSQHQQGQVNLGQSGMQTIQQAMSLDQDDLFGDFGFDQQLFQNADMDFSATGVDFYNNSSPQYPSHFIAQQQQQQSFYIQQQQQQQQDNFIYQPALQGNYDGVSISTPNQQSRIYNMTNQVQNFSPAYMHQSSFNANNNGAQYQQQKQQQMLLQRQQQAQQQAQQQQRYQQQLQQQKLQQQKQQQGHQQYYQQYQNQYQQAQQQQTISFQQQSSPVPTSKANKRTSRNTKRKVKYEESSSEEEEEMMEEEIEELDDLSDDSDFDVPKKQKNTATAAAIAEAPVVLIPMGTRIFEKMLDYRLNPTTGQPELLVKYKVKERFHLAVC